MNKAWKRENIFCKRPPVGRVLCGGKQELNRKITTNPVQLPTTGVAWIGRDTRDKIYVENPVKVVGASEIVRLDLWVCGSVRVLPRPSAWVSEELCCVTVCVGACARIEKWFLCTRAGICKLIESYISISLDTRHGHHRHLRFTQQATRQTSSSSW